MYIDGYYTDSGLLCELLVARNLNFEDVHIARKNYIQLINYIQHLSKENDSLKEKLKENELLKEELKELKDGIIGIYNNMNALEIINKKELEEVEEL